MVPALRTPVTIKLPNVPTEVIFGCAPVVSVPPKVVPVIAPEDVIDVVVIPLIKDPNEDQTPPCLK